MISTIPKWLTSLFGQALQPNVKSIEIDALSPEIKRIRFKGDLSKWNMQLGYASVIRISETEFRNYTIASYDQVQGIFDVIFYINGKGIGSQKIGTLQKEEVLFISPPRGKRMYESSVHQQVFFGDETSLGLAYSLFPLLKQNNHQFHFYFELNPANNHLPAVLGLDNYTVKTKDKNLDTEKWNHLLDSSTWIDWEEAAFILTGNAITIQQQRKILKERKAGKILSQGYWVEGKKGG
ncbi:FAD-binding oxidoreductase [Myroides odoratus]|uniref:FAD-binding oxidoreductase n=1 Tax=Myroides odoratus TaxID=256 RepID=UPI0039B10703